MKNLGFGLMRLPLLADGSGKIDIERVKKLADRFLEEGFTYFDTAACYHSKESEDAFRLAVAERYDRERYSITDKLSLFMLKAKEEIAPFFDAQLQRLGVDYLDVYLIHSLDRGAYKTATEWGAFEFVKAKLDEGKVKHIGFSFHDDAETLDMILTEHPEVEFVQLQINYIDWEDERVQSRRCYEVAVRHGKKVIVMEPVKGGSLVRISDNAKSALSEIDRGMSVASFAIRFAASLPNVVMVLSGMSNEEQVEDNLSYMKEFKPFDEERMNSILKVAEDIKNEITVACTACRYCVDYCPMKIAIPDYFTYYNSYNRFKSLSGRDRGFVKKLLEENGKPSDCIECGACEERCPQMLEIRKYLKDCARAFEK